MVTSTHQPLMVASPFRWQTTLVTDRNVIDCFASETTLGYAAGDTNLYRYCGNSPTNATDPSGHIVNVAVGAGIGGVVGAGFYLGQTWLTGSEFNWSELGIATAAGIGTGAVAGATMGLSLVVQGAAAGAAGGAIYAGATSAGQNNSLGQVAMDTTMGAAVGAVGGAAGGYIGGRLLGNAATASFSRHLRAGVVEGAVDGFVGGAYDGYTQTGSLAGTLQGAVYGTAYGGVAGGAIGSYHGKQKYKNSFDNLPHQDVRPRVGADYSDASGTTVYRHIPAESQHRLANAMEGVVEPRSLQDGRMVRDADPLSRAARHDDGRTDGSGFTSWSTDIAWINERVRKMNGIVIQIEAPKGSMWQNKTAQGVEVQVLVPGSVKGNVIVRRGV